jgi:uncharacterized protein YyaL (SSP411 family)
MLYDNAMLARVYVLAFRAFGNPDDARIARETLDYLLREMTPESGGFFAAQDADSEGREGVFYVWDPRTLADAVGSDAAPVVAARFGVTPAGNFEDGQTVLSVVASLADLAKRFARPEGEIAALLEDARFRMYEARARRVWPARDEKLLTDWTALAISAFALAGRVLSEPRYETAAREAADRILRECRRSRASPPTTPISSRRCSTSTRRLSSRAISARRSTCNENSTSDSSIRPAVTLWLKGRTTA